MDQDQYLPLKLYGMAGIDLRNSEFLDAIYAGIGLRLQSTRVQRIQMRIVEPALNIINLSPV